MQYFDELDARPHLHGRPSQGDASQGISSPAAWAASRGQVETRSTFSFVPLLVLALGVFGLRLPTIDFDVLNVDEAVYHIMGAAWLHGSAPHLGIVDNKPLGLYFIHAAAQVLFNDPVIGARLLGAAATLLSSWLLMILARRFLGLSTAAGVLCGLLFSTYAILLGGDASQGPVFYVPLVVGGALVVMGEIQALKQGAAPSLMRLAGAGLFLGLSLQVKYVTVFECAAFGLFFLHAGWKTANADLWRKTLAGAAVLAAGGLLPTAMAYGAYVLMGHGAEFLFYTFGSNLQRAVTGEPLSVIASRMALVGIAFMPLMLLSLEFLRARRTGWIGRFLAFWFLAALGGGIAQLQFCDHYFYEAMAPLAVMAGAALLPATRAVRTRAVLTAALVLGLGAFGYATVKLNAVAENGPPFEPSRIASDIASSGAQSMYVFNYDSLLYVLSGIPLPTRYPLSAHLLRDINADMFEFDARTEIKRILDDNQDVIVVSRPMGDAVSEDRRRLVEAKLRDDYCLWREYQAGPRKVDLYLQRGSGLPAASAACVKPQEPDEWVSASRRHTPPHPGANRVRHRPRMMDHMTGLITPSLTQNQQHVPQDAVLHDPWEHAAPGTRGKALVVEDDPAVLEVTVFLLQDLGYAVSTAITAAAALEIARQTAFDLVLSDISLPGDFNGIQLAKQLRQGHPDLPIILATGFTESFADAAGEFIVLRKPYRAEDLTTAISLEAR